jgi:uncharacterized membrane protein HdeD (DUF308 family)
MIETIKKHKGLLTFEGILFIVFGILAVALPGLFTLGIELIIGWLFIISGIFQLFRTFRVQSASLFLVSLLSSILSIVVGGLLVTKPLAGILTLTILLAIFFLLEGISEIALALKFRAAPNWGWLLFSGLVTLLLAVIIFLGWPSTAAWVIGLLVGINMIFFGFSLISLAVGAK